MSSLEAIAAAQTSLETLLTHKFAEFESALQTAPPRADTIAALRVELDKFKEATLAMLKVIRQQISALSSTVDNIEMRHRRKYLLLSGVPEASNENVAEAVAVICRERLQLPEVSSSSFSVCHRLGAPVAGQSRSILVRCSNVALKDTIWRKKTALKGSPIVVSEFLTRQRQAIFLDARKKFGMRRVWTYDGTIFIKLPTGELHRIVTAEQLNKLYKDHPITVPLSTVEQPDVKSGSSATKPHPAASSSGVSTPKGDSAALKADDAAPKSDTVAPKSDPTNKKPAETARSTRRQKAPAQDAAIPPKVTNFK